MTSLKIFVDKPVSDTKNIENSVSWIAQRDHSDSKVPAPDSDKENLSAEEVRYCISLLGELSDLMYATTKINRGDAYPNFV